MIQTKLNFVKSNLCGSFVNLEKANSEIFNEKVKETFIFINQKESEMHFLLKLINFLIKYFLLLNEYFESFEKFSF